MSTTHRVWRLRSRPVNSIKDTDLELCVEDKPAIGPDQVLVKNMFISIDPTHRIWMSDRSQYMPPVGLGEVMRAATVGVVEVSNNAAFPVGTHLFGFGGVAEYYLGIIGVTVFYKAGELGLPLTADLSVCSVIVGLAGWHGANKVLAPDSNSIIAVSGAAGAVGSIVGQLCKLKGAKVVGIAGSDAKLAWMKNELKFDAVINYKTQDVEKELAAFAPEGLTGYFDNVGGSVTDAVLMNLRNNAKVAVCGSISEYDDKWSGQKNWNMILMRRLSIHGYICTDHMDELAAMQTEMSSLVKKGDLKYAEDIRKGIENYPSVVRLLMSGENTGKLILQV